MGLGVIFLASSHSYINVCLIVSRSPSFGLFPPFSHLLCFPRVNRAFLSESIYKKRTNHIFHRRHFHAFFSHLVFSHSICPTPSGKTSYPVPCVEVLVLAPFYSNFKCVVSNVWGLCALVHKRSCQCIIITYHQLITFQRTQIND